MLDKFDKALAVYSGTFRSLFPILRYKWKTLFSSLTQRWNTMPLIVNVKPIAVMALAILVGPLGSGEQVAGDDLWLHQKNCPLASLFPVVGSAYGVKNIAHKTITSYTLACFSRKGKSLSAMPFDERVRETVRPGEQSGEYGFDATPPNYCRHQSGKLGVYSVEFSDGTTWVTSHRNR